LSVAATSKVRSTDSPSFVGLRVLDLTVVRCGAIDA